jgi:hypothetical protein
MFFFPRVLGALAFLFAGTIAIELKFISCDDETPIPAAVAPSPPPLLRSPPSGEDRAATILARPLFSAGRHPAAAVSPLPPRLAGTLIAPSGKRALFAGDTGRDVYSVVAEGDRLGDWTVRAIDAGTVTVTGPNGVRALRVNFEGAPAQTGMVSVLPGPGPTRSVRAHGRKEPRGSPS